MDVSDCSHHPRRDDGLGGLRCAFCGSPLERVDDQWQAANDDDGRVAGP